MSLMSLMLIWLMNYQSCFKQRANLITKVATMSAASSAGQTPMEAPMGDSKRSRLLEPADVKEQALEDAIIAGKKESERAWQQRLQSDGSMADMVTDERDTPENTPMETQKEKPKTKQQETPQEHLKQSLRWAEHLEQRRQGARKRAAKDKMRQGARKRTAKGVDCFYKQRDRVDLIMALDLQVDRRLQDEAHDFIMAVKEGRTTIRLMTRRTTIKDA